MKKGVNNLIFVDNIFYPLGKIVESLLILKIVENLYVMYVYCFYHTSVKKYWGEVNLCMIRVSGVDIILAKMNRFENVIVLINRL